MNDVVLRFQDIFNRLDSRNLHLIAELYAQEIVFRDPLHEVRGVEALTNYFASMYDGVEECRFEFHAAVQQPGEAMLTWTMSMRHARFRKGETVNVPGASHIRFNDKVTYHQDYFDVGKLIYERVPILGAVVRSIKARL